MFLHLFFIQYMNKHLLLVASLASLPLISTAQTASESPRFYVGLGASFLTDRGFRSTSYSNDPTFGGPALTLGAQLSPRLALQVGAGYAWRNTSSFTAYPNDYNGAANSNSSESHLRVFTLPVLLRYTFTDAPSRFNIDALGGITVMHSTTHYSYTSIVGGRVNFTDSGDYSSTKANVTLGPSLRYALAPKLEVTAAPLVNAVIGDTYNNFSDRLFWNLLVGVHYTFGQ
jgi:hypothetical protein